MPGVFTREEFRQGWRYAVDTDLHPVDTSTSAHMTRLMETGSEGRSIPLIRPPSDSFFDASLNSNGSLLGFACGTEIDVYNTQTLR